MATNWADIPSTSIELASGQTLDYANPNFYVCLLDLFCGAKNLTRYQGVRFVNLLVHTSVCLSVARSKNFDDQMLAYVAAHDLLTEPYVGEHTTPLKNFIPSLRSLEHKIALLTYPQVGLIYPMPPNMEHQVKIVDMEALMIEMKATKHPGYEKRFSSVPVDISHYINVIGNKPEVLFEDIMYCIESYTNVEIPSQ